MSIYFILMVLDNAPLEATSTEYPPVVFWYPQEKTPILSKKLKK